MKRNAFSQLLLKLFKFTTNQAKHVIEALCLKDTRHRTKEIIAAEYTQPVCPSCGKSSSTKWGIVSLSGATRYRLVKAVI